MEANRAPIRNSKKLTGPFRVLENYATPRPDFSRDFHHKTKRDIKR